VLLVIGQDFCGSSRYNSRPLSWPLAGSIKSNFSKNPKERTMRAIAFAVLAAVGFVANIHAQTAAPAATPPAAKPAAAAPAPVAIDKNKLSYALGFKTGSDVNHLADSGIVLDMAQVIRGMQDAAGKKTPAFAKEDLYAQLESLQDRLGRQAEAEYNKVAGDNKAKSDKFMTDNKAKKGIVVMPNGIQYRVIEEGNGARPTKTSEVTVQYRAMIAASSVEFDSTYARGQPAKFKLDQVFKGLQEIMPLMKVGDNWQVYFPAEMAYGERAPQTIGPNQALMFDIKLLEVK
jgi:FKBP-type peptidyl-prolyl cis-trans isomerase FklB